MRCPYCRTMNDIEEARCAHCGRRLREGAPRAEAGPQPVAGAVAPVIEFTSRRQHVESSGEDLAPRAMSAAAGASSQQASLQSQQALFQEPDWRDQDGPARAGLAGNVVPIPTLTPHRPNSRESKRERAKRRTTARPPRRMSDPQQNLEFVAAQVDLRQRPEERIDCDAPVAVPTHRLMAAAVDGSMILLGVLVFAGAFLTLGGSSLPVREMMFVLLGVWAVVAMLYKGMWCLVEADSLGLRAVGLRLVDFDGRAPSRRARVIRAASGMMSLAAAGMGLLWTLVDEERLSWHDHISKTFPTVE